jgi:hypothetical protein
LSKCGESLNREFAGAAQRSQMRDQGILQHPLPFALSPFFGAKRTRFNSVATSPFEP